MEKTQKKVFYYLPKKLIPHLAAGFFSSRSAAAFLTKIRRLTNK